MDDEFDTVAGWTADAALELGDEHLVPAACRGSGGPAALSWLLENLQTRRSDRLLDCGAGVGGPAAFAARHAGLRPVLVEPETMACRAARRMFGLPVVQGDAQALPFPDGVFDVAWSLAVLCTTSDYAAVLRELRRVVRPGGRIGLLVYTRTVPVLDEQPAGNTFVTDDDFDRSLVDLGLGVTAASDLDNVPAGDSVPADPSDWSERANDVETLVARRHGGSRAWQSAQEQADIFGRLLSTGQVHGRLLVVEAG